MTPATISPPRGAKSMPTPSNSPDEDLDREFSEFRESAVRLVERVTDLVGPSGDPVAAVQADLKIVRSIFGKWSADILISLHAVPSIGFEELRRSMPGISPRVLSMKLKELEQNGMVQREIIDTRPPRVRYSLTQRGWTVAWLSQPVFLFLRLTDRGPRAKASEQENPATLGR
jgi:DNA-binding HxlR family transcriptional regulator